MFHSASKEGEAETGGAEGQEAVFQWAADDPAVQKRQRSNFDGDVVCDGDDDTDRNRFVVYLLTVPTAESTGMVKKIRALGCVKSPPRPEEARTRNHAT